MLGIRDGPVCLRLHRREPRSMRFTGTIARRDRPLPLEFRLGEPDYQGDFRRAELWGLEDDAPLGGWIADVKGTVPVTRNATPLQILHPPHRPFQQHP
jgi:hypothetical protein